MKFFGQILEELQHPLMRTSSACEKVIVFCEKPLLLKLAFASLISCPLVLALKAIREKPAFPVHLRNSAC